MRLDFLIFVDEIRSRQTSSHKRLMMTMGSVHEYRRRPYMLSMFSCSLNSLLSAYIKVSNITGHQALRADPHLFKDDVDIRFSRTLNSCKLPQIRYATPERLLQRLTDLRFLSIDFLNTFLLTYRVFTGERLLIVIYMRRRRLSFCVIYKFHYIQFSRPPLTHRQTVRRC